MQILPDFYPVRNLLKTLLGLSLTMGRLQAGLDLNGNALSDLWESQFNAQALSGAVDTDKDGFTNAAEALAGTDPFSAASHPALAIAPVDSGHVRLSTEGVAGNAMRSFPVHR